MFDCNKLLALVRNSENSMRNTSRLGSDKRGLWAQVGACYLRVGGGCLVYGTPARRDSNRLRCTRMAVVLAVLAVGCSSTDVNLERVGSVDAESVTEVLPPCPAEPVPNSIDEEAFMALVNAGVELISQESGWQAASARAGGLVGVEFVDPPLDRFDELLAQLPDGFCIASIQFTPEAPLELAVISESGEVSASPETVGDVRIWLSADVGRPPADATEILLVVEEVDCASGQAPGDRLPAPEVHESDDEVLIAAGVQKQITEQLCPGNPTTPVSVTLKAPVGDREIRNALTGELLGVGDPSE